jgi:putative ABC transport system substrate-binding protein
MNNRRKLLIVLGAGALAAPLASFAQQQGKVWRVGFLSSRSRPTSLDFDLYGAFPRGMRELGYVEGKNLMIEWRFADGKNERLPALAAELVKLNVDNIVAGGAAAIVAAQQATTKIPIVMVNSGDPVGSGFVKTLAHPGGNITGLSNIIGEIGPKHLEMLLSFVPKLSNVAILLNPDNSSYTAILENLHVATRKTKLRILPVGARSPQEIESAFSMMIKEKIGAVIVVPDGLFTLQRRQISELAAKNRLPSISARGDYAEAGVLMSYGQNIADSFRHAATYVDKIFKGARPGDLPVEQPTTFELFINRKTAKALGLTIPQSLLISADKVIE